MTIVNHRRKVWFARFRSAHICSRRLYRHDPLRATDSFRSTRVDDDDPTAQAQIALLARGARWRICVWSVSLTGGPAVRCTARDTVWPRTLHIIETSVVASVSCFGLRKLISMPLHQLKNGVASPRCVRWRQISEVSTHNNNWNPTNMRVSGLRRSSRQSYCCRYVTAKA